MSDNASKRSPSMRMHLIKQVAVPSMVLFLSIVAWWVVTSRETPLPEPPTPPSVEVIPPQEDREAREAKRRREMFEEAVQPEIEAIHQANLKAVQDCIARIDSAFRRYHQGVEPFVEDVTSMGTRFGILSRMPGQWWNEDQRVNVYVRQKFEKHLFSDARIRNDVSAALVAFRDQIHDNRQELLVQVKANVSQSDFPEIKLPDYEAHMSELNRRLQEFATSRGVDSVVNGVVTMVASEVATVAATAIAVRVGTSIGTAAAASAASAGGATVGGTAAGGAGGTAVGPVGTAIGAGVGLVAGLLVDWWMTDKFRSKLASELRSYLNRMRGDIVEGPAGLRKALMDYIELEREAQRDVYGYYILGEAL
ncbi:MAG: hypothetical protein KatS3mg111_3929 [Pirellulaceae bacterium]|nr:MAG: hypothetical protein KatS3mg111_3929 [Pirellulaceae bacterium]